MRSKGGLKETIYKELEKRVEEAEKILNEEGTLAPPKLSKSDVLIAVIALVITAIFYFVSFAFWG